jgi:ATP-dependent protease ClpP protease subunit
MKTAERYYRSGGNCLGKISLVKSVMQIARYGGIEFRRASDINIVTGFFLPLCFYFLMLGHQEVLAAPARVEGRVKCYKSVGNNECYFTIWLTGEIDSSTVNDVKQVLDRRQVWVAAEKEEIGLGPGLGHEFYIDSPGGNLAAAIAIGRMIRKERLTLVITKGHECVSACVMVLAGAAHRGIYGRVGIHRPFFELSIGSEPMTPDKVKTNYQKMLQEIRAYLREMNVSERLADDMLAIDPADVRYLSINQLYDYGIKGVDPVEQETIDLQAAQALGLDRREYMRREAVRKEQCLHETIEAMSACNERVMKFGR